jgi:hypothetical protein
MTKNPAKKNREIESKSGKKQLWENENLDLAFQKHRLRSVKALFLHPETTVYSIP